MCQYWVVARAAARRDGILRDFVPANGFVLTAGKGGRVVVEDPVVVLASSIVNGKAKKQINRKVDPNPAAAQFWLVEKVGAEKEEESAV